MFNIERAFKRRKEKGYTKLYIVIDAHDTIISGTYKLNNEGAGYLPYAKEVLQYLSKRNDVVLILWTSGHIEPTLELRARFEKDNIDFKYINENPELPNDKLCDFTKKFAFDILLEDKSGFDKYSWLLFALEWERVTGQKILEVTVDLIDYLDEYLEEREKFYLKLASSLI